MSEYQYYEFQAVDRPLSQKEMAELRALSTRATITPHRFVNVYNWGDFRGDPTELTEKYFDAFVYAANWGTYQLMLRLPSRLLTPETVGPYCTSEWLTSHRSGDNLILGFLYNDESGEDDKGLGWVTDEQAASWLPGLLPLRAELAGGDLRCLYLGWLLCAECEMLEDDDIEPPVPLGLGQLSAAQRAFVEFFWIDQTLIEVAAERSAPLEVFSPSREQLEQWIHQIPDAEKDALLVRLAAGDDSHLGAELQQRFRRAAAAGSEQTTMAPASRRTVGELVSAADQRTEAKRREEAEREAQAKARRIAARARARAAHLDKLAIKQDETWRLVDVLIEEKRAKSYDQAATLLQDLHDVAVREEQTDRFNLRLTELRERNAKRLAMLKRLNQLGL